MSLKKVAEAVLVFTVPFLSVTGAIPTLRFPVNAQVPPVARVSQAFQFTFAKSTFTSTAGPMTYTLSGQPEWLQIDSGRRALSGTPTQDNLGPLDFQLIASDAQGSTSQRVTFVVVRDEVLVAGESIISQLATFGPSSSPATLILYPLQPFAFTFSTDTFVRTSSTTAYYAISQDNSPLPSWLEFDDSNLGFSGTTPPLVSPTATPQTFGVKLIASDVAGFAEATAIFQIVVGYHVLAFAVSEQMINTTGGQEVVTPPLRGTLRLDGEAIQDSDIVSVTSDIPSWLTLDTEKISLSGVPPANDAILNVTISVQDVHGDIANATLNFLSLFTSTNGSTRLFLGNPNSANATIGDSFNYTISENLLSSSNVTVMADLKSASAWLAFNSSDLTLEGQVPQNLPLGQINVTLFAMAGNVTDTAYLDINIVRGSTTTMPLSTNTLLASKTSSSLSTAQPSNLPGQGSQKTLSRQDLVKIVLAVVLPTAFLLFLALMLCCCRRRWHASTEPNAEVPNGPTTTIVEEQNMINIAEVTAIPPTVPAPHSHETELHVEPSQPPRIELSWAPDSLRTNKARLSKRLSSQETSFMDLRWNQIDSQDLERPVLNIPTSEVPSNDEHGNPRKTVPSGEPSSPQQRAPLWLVQSRTQERAHPERASRALSGRSAISQKLPNRLSGAGHGAGRISPSRVNDFRNSWQDTVSSLHGMDSRASSIDIAEAFPLPPTEDTASGNMHSLRRSIKPSLRMVPASSSNSESLADQRQRWYTQRACGRLERGARFSSIDALAQSEITNCLSSPGRPSARARSGLRRECSTASSGQFDSAMSTPSSLWEDERLAEEQDPEEDENQDASTWRADASGAGSGPYEERAARASASRTLRLGDVPGSRPVSVGEGNLQRTQRSQQGSLAFV